MMKASTVAGTCHGAFFYKNDHQETDIEIITGHKFQGVHYTNQRASANAAPSTLQKALPADATTVFQEYRVDWVPGRTDFYLDGQLQKSLTENVPTTPGSWLWNNWRYVVYTFRDSSAPSLSVSLTLTHSRHSNGDEGWTGAPPLQDNVMEISKIEMYYNRTSSAGTCK